MDSTSIFVECPIATLPANLRWGTPMRNQGQAVEVSYAEPGASDEAAPRTAMYKRVVDRAFPSGSPERETYYRRVQVWLVAEVPQVGGGVRRIYTAESARRASYLRQWARDAGVDALPSRELIVRGP